MTNCSICGDMLTNNINWNPLSGLRCDDCLNQRSRERHHRLRLEVLRHYSPEIKCAICGFNDWRALQLDHINGDGYIRKPTYGSRYYDRLIKEGFPKGLQVLCANCNWIKKYENDENHHPFKFKGHIPTK